MSNVYNPERNKGKVNSSTPPRYFEVWFYREMPSYFGISEKFIIIMKMENLRHVHKYQLI